MNKGEKERTALSPVEAVKGLRSFIYAGALWGAWSRTAGIGTAIFTGYALWLGASESDIALLVSLASFTSLVQPFSVILSSRAEHKKRFVLAFGFFEIFFRFAVIGIPLLFPRSIWIPMMMILVAMGLISGYALSPLFNSWLASTIPEPIRARYTSKRIVIRTLVAIVIGYVLGQFMDLFPGSEQYTGFRWAFLFGLVTGYGGYLMLLRAPFPRTEENASRMNLRSLLIPFREKRFRRALLFNISRNVVIGVASPFYSVFMLKTLELSYSTVALFNNLFMGAMLLSYWMWGALVDRYGSKPVLQVILAPMGLVILLWAFNRPGHYALIPVVMVLRGFLQSGVQVAITPLLYSLLPKQGDKSVYFASWSSSVNLAYSVAPVIGAFLVRQFEPLHFELLGAPMGNLQMVFLISACGMILPNLLLRLVQEPQASTSRRMLAQIGRGNPFSFAFNFFIFTLSAEEKRRAQAVRAMGRSKSPMAVEKLIDALEDPSPQVRSQAAEALGHTGAEEAVEPLVQRLTDEESDIRPQAAEALGRIGHARGMDPLFQALHNEDLRIRISAIRALTDIGGNKAREWLFWMFCETFDRNMFPTLVEALSTLGDLRIVKPTLKRLNAYRSPVIRSQLLNAICRLVGAGNRFYRILSQDELGRAAQIEGLLREARRALSSAKGLEARRRRPIERRLDEIGRHFEVGAYQDMVEKIGEIGQVLWNTPSSDLSPSAQAAALAIDRLVGAQDEADLSEEEAICVVVCLVQLIQTLRGPSNHYQDDGEEEEEV